MPILEAMASGCPVVCSDRGAPAEIADKSALLVNMEQPEAVAVAVRELSEPSIRERYIAMGLQRAAQFDWLTAARKHRRIYESIARQPA